MQRYVAFLRGVNLGKRRLPMNRLKALRLPTLTMRNITTIRKLIAKHGPGATGSVPGIGLSPIRVSSGQVG